MLYEITYESFNYMAVMGCMLGLSIILMLESLASNAVTFVKGWRT